MSEASKSSQSPKVLVPDKSTPNGTEQTDLVRIPPGPPTNGGLCCCENLGFLLNYPFHLNRVLAIRVIAVCYSGLDKPVLSIER